MTYVEFLRVRRTLTVYSIIIAILAAIAVVTAFSAYGDVVIGGHARTLILRDAIAVHFAKHRTIIPISALFFEAGFAATILASIFAAYLCAERSHTPLSWTKPASREGFALRYMGVDLLAMAATFIITLVIGGLFVSWGFGVLGYVSVDAQAWTTLALILGIALAYYGVARALTVGFPSRGGAIVGTSWAIAFALIILAAAPLPIVLHDIVIALNFLNPLAYLTHGDQSTMSGVVPLSVPMRIVCVWTLAVLSSALAILIYRRAEA